MPIPKVRSSEVAHLTSAPQSALHTYVLRDQFHTPDELALQLRACHLTGAFEKDRIALAQLLEQLLQFTLRQRSGVSLTHRGEKRRRR